LKAEVCGGRRGSSSPRAFPLFLCGGRPARDAMAPMCDEGFSPSIADLLPPRAGRKRESEYGERSRKARQIEREAK
jgi:hypothetical protein